MSLVASVAVTVRPIASLAETDEADWTEVARIVLHIDPSREPARAWRAWESHLARAKWMTEHGYRRLLRSGAPDCDVGGR